MNTCNIWENETEQVLGIMVMCLYQQGNEEKTKII